MQTKNNISGHSKAVNGVFLILITIAALLLRLFLFPLESGDYHQFLKGWFATLKENGRSEERRVGKECRY